MSDHIEPALTAEEWKPQLRQLAKVTATEDTQVIDVGGSHPDAEPEIWIGLAGDWSTRARARMESTWQNVPFDVRLPALFVNDGDNPAVIRSQKQIVAVIALANAALPDDDPRKITRADVTRCRVAAYEAEARHDGTIERSDYETMNAWRQLADKLAALLPPEPTDG